MNLTKTLVPLFHLWVHFWIFHGQKRKKTAVQPRRTIYDRLMYGRMFTTGVLNKLLSDENTYKNQLDSMKVDIKRAQN